MSLISKTLTISDAQRRLLDVVQDIEQTGEIITITKNGIPTTVMIRVEDYESIIETLEILANPKIMKSLLKSKKQIGKGKLLGDDEVWH